MTRSLTRTLRGALLGAAVLAFALPAAHAENMQKVVDNMVTVFRDFQGGGGAEASIPDAVMAKAYAVAIVDTTTGGVIFTGSSGDGVILARTQQGWSGPVGLTTSGGGFGLAIGGQDTRLVLLVMNPKSLKTIVANNNINFKGMFEAAGGPTAVDVATWEPKADIYSYKVNDGVFAGAGFKGGVLEFAQEETNQYYQQPVTAMQVLSGKLPAPAGATALIDLMSIYNPAPGMPGYQNQVPSPLIVIESETLEVDEGM